MYEVVVKRSLLKSIEKMPQPIQRKMANVFETEWYRQIKLSMTPGDNLKIYRDNRGWTQAQLGDKLGGLPRQHISNMERGVRPISKNMAKRLALIFAVPPSKFI